jgi:hypothetical protein
MFPAVDNYPAIVGATVRSTMHIMDTCDIPSSRREICLSVCEDGDVCRSTDPAIEVVIDDDIYELLAAVRHDDTQGQHCVASVWAAAPVVRVAYCNSTDHDVIDVAVLT